MITTQAWMVKSITYNLARWLKLGGNDTFQAKQFAIDSVGGVAFRAYKSDGYIVDRSRARFLQVAGHMVNMVILGSWVPIDYGRMLTQIEWNVASYVHGKTSKDIAKLILNYRTTEKISSRTVAQLWHNIWEWIVGINAGISWLTYIHVDINAPVKWIYDRLVDISVRHKKFFDDSISIRSELKNLSNVRVLSKPGDLDLIAVVMPMATGKTTLVKKYSRLVDIDDLIPDSIREVLSHLLDRAISGQDGWEKHNSLIRRHVRPRLLELNKLEHNLCIMQHSYEEALHLGFKIPNILQSKTTAILQQQGLISRTIGVVPRHLQELSMISWMSVVTENIFDSYEEQTLFVIDWIHSKGVVAEFKMN
jgi:hypothetical protein